MNFGSPCCKELSVFIWPSWLCSRSREKWFVQVRQQQGGGLPIPLMGEHPGFSLRSRCSPSPNLEQPGEGSLE